MKTNWGLLPDDVREIVLKKEWQHSVNLKNSLKGHRAFPLEVGLKPPTSGNMLLDNATHFQHFVEAWQQFETQKKGIRLNWVNKNYRHFSEQKIPHSILIEDLNSLANFLGPRYVTQLTRWSTRFRFLLQTLPKTTEVFECLVDFLSEIDQLNDDELHRLRLLIPQFHQFMGRGMYLRAITVEGVDTKFIEQHFALIESILHSIHHNVKPQGLLSWLGCIPKPKDWLLVKPLCANTQKKLGNLPLLRLNSETLIHIPLPATHILIVENEQSCLALPEIEDAIAVGGGGKNLVWLNAEWLKQKNVAYWGDIDTDGLMMLNQAKEKVPHLVALMMNEETCRHFKARMVNSPLAMPMELSALSHQEKVLFEKLQQDKFGNNRLEQERIDQDWILRALDEWLQTAFRSAEK